MIEVYKINCEVKGMQNKLKLLESEQTNSKPPWVKWSMSATSSRLSLISSRPSSR